MMSTIGPQTRAAWVSIQMAETEVIVLYIAWEGHGIQSFDEN